MELDYKNTKEHIFNFYTNIKKHQTALKTYSKVKKLIVLLIGIFISISIVFFRWNTFKVNDEVSPEDILYIVLPIVIALIVIILSLLFAKINNRENLEEELKKIDFDEEIEVNVSFQKDGIVYKKNDVEMKYNWNFVKTIKEEKDVLYIVFKNMRGIVIPLNIFGEDINKDEVIKIVKENIN